MHIYQLIYWMTVDILEIYYLPGIDFFFWELSAVWQSSFWNCTLQIFFGVHFDEKINKYVLHFFPLNNIKLIESLHKMNGNQVYSLMHYRWIQNIFIELYSNAFMCGCFIKFVCMYLCMIFQYFPKNLSCFLYFILLI